MSEQPTPDEVASEQGGTLLPARRRQLILDALSSGSAGVAELAESFSVSEMTVRRDLARLTREGKLTRVHGGAVRDRDEPPFAEIAVERRSEKERIGRAAADLVADGQTIMIDIGTTTLELARHLRDRRLTVITNNLAVVDALMPASSVEVGVIGGVVRRNYRSLVGMLAEESLRSLAADIAFLGASGISDDLSVMDTTIVEVPIKRAMMAAAQRTVLLVDEKKFDMLGSIRICGAEEIDRVVTDATPDHPGVRALAHAGVDVVQV